MPSTTNWGLEYESPSSLPGITLTGGPGNVSPILAVQVDGALNTLSGQIDGLTDDIADINGEITDLGVDIAAGQTSITNLTNWTRTGTTNVTFTSVTSNTSSVSFGFTFPAAPRVMTNIDSGAGATALWCSRAINISTTGFSMFVFQTQGSAGTWTSIPVSYTATYRP